MGTKTALYTWSFAERRIECLCHTLFDSLPKKLLALDKRWSRSLLTVASLEVTPPSYVKCFTAFRFVLSMRELLQHLSLLKADGESEVLACIREAVDDVL